MLNMTEWKRRMTGAFVAWAVALPAAALEVRFLYVGADDDPALLGVRQGLDEANLQGRFLGQNYVLDVRAPDAAPAAPDGVAAIFAAVDGVALRSVAAAAPAVPVFNLRDADDALRGACIPNLLHTIPSAAMARDAVAQWRRMHPGAEVTARAWHHDFTKYAGRDLNKRFRAATGRNMDEYAWSGWAAVKMASDTVARLNAAEPGQLLAHLRTALRFDGQKGVEMTFRETGQLRQPMLIIEGDRIAGEAPVRGVADPDDLDTLGNTGCAG
jgi:hypothetical protein